MSRDGRHLLGALLADLDNVVVAPCSRHDGPAGPRAELAARLLEAGIEWPVLVRPAASHGGEGLVRCETFEALQSALCDIDGAHYLTGFFDYRHADGLYRRYRIVFADRKPFAYHLAISAHWMVRWFTTSLPT
ncbi:MAG: hypothetical protein M3Y55_10295 [Pseudomonadota bacterium]|nr:hypothetical protein [Pseudomonadota bacterium]